MHNQIIIIGAGVAGISTAYYLSQKYKLIDVLIVDAMAPMSLTSAMSGENYRNWWPHPTMTDFINHSIDLMEDIALRSNDIFNMTRRGYLLASRNRDPDALISQLIPQLVSNDQAIRFHRSSTSDSYQPPESAHWRDAPDGIDVLSNQNLIRQYFPSLSKEIHNLVHIRRAGDISSQQLGQYMLSQAKSSGVKFLQVKVTDIDKAENFNLRAIQGDSEYNLSSALLINAAGPFSNQIAQMLGQSLPIKNVLQQKIAFEDVKQAIPRDLPFCIDLDPCVLDFSDEERALLAEDEDYAWLTKTIQGSIHCRPDGPYEGKRVKLGWAINQQPSDALWQPHLDEQYPEIVLRGAARLNPELKKYYGRFPTSFSHYGGYYPMTSENWPLIGPMGIDDTYMVGALSGYGSMAACAAGQLCADWVAAGPLPEYAHSLSLARYQNQALMDELKNANRGIL